MWNDCPGAAGKSVLIDTWWNVNFSIPREEIAFSEF